MQGFTQKIKTLPTADQYLLVILILAFIVRLAFMWVYPDQNFPDAKAYNTIGNEIFAGKIITNNTYMPLYPIWVAMTGGGISHIFMDIIISVASVWLIYSIFLEIFSNTAGALLSAIVASLYPHFLFYSVSGLTETFYTFLLLLSFLYFYRKKYILAITILVLSLLVKPTLDILNPILIVLFIGVVHKSGYKKIFKYLSVYSVIYIVLLLPWWVHQYEKYGEFVRFNLADGIVLYSGNNPLNTSGGGVARDNGSSDMNLEQFNYIKNPVRRNEVIKKSAIDYIMKNPYRFLELAGVKFTRFWRLWPHTEYYQQWYVIATSLLSYGVILFLAIGFLLRNVKIYFRKIIPIFALFGYLTLVHMVTIGSIRYRFPLEPFLIIFASYFFIDFVKKYSWFDLVKNKTLSNL
jgi:hypothetical protein